MAEKHWHEEYHAQRFAVRNMPTASFFVMFCFCALEVYLSWKLLDRAFQAYNFFAVLRNVVVIAACTQSLMKLHLPFITPVYLHFRTFSRSPIRR